VVVQVEKARLEGVQPEMINVLVVVVVKLVTVEVAVLVEVVVVVAVAVNSEVKREKKSNHLTKRKGSASREL